MTLPGYRQIKIFIIFFLFISFSLSADSSFCFRLYLKDKGKTSFNILSPEKFLSSESVNRRMLREVPVDEKDIPVSQAYIDTLAAIGAPCVVSSKWMKTVVVECSDSALVEQVKALSFVDSVRCVWKGKNRLVIYPCPEDTSHFLSMEEPVKNIYGYAEAQIEMINGVPLHNAGYRGENMRIAVVDAGFMNVDKIEAFSSIHLLGTRNITFPGRSVFCEDEHGTKVLSCLAANLRGVMTGSAPEASYLLIKSEDSRGEFPIEEDFWAAAVEYADSVGVDIISSSLGYHRFDNECDYYQQADLNGQTAFTSCIAKIASEKGMLIVCSAGNEGNGEWEKITFPADAEDVISVGGITHEKERSSFSSVGITSDFRIKPDVVTLGTGVCVISSSGRINHTNGTSFSAPVIAGLAACLWQAFPLLKNKELIKLIIASASQSKKPDSQLGYGIPNMYNAYKKACREALRN